MPEASEAGPSSQRSLDTDLVFCTYRDLYEHLEGIRRTRPASDVEQLVKQRLPKLQRCGQVAPTPSKTPLKAGKTRLPDGTTEVDVDEEQRKLAVKISERYDIDQLEAFVYLRSFLRSEDRSLDVLVANSRGNDDDSQQSSSSRKRAKGSNKDQALEEFLDAFNVFYFEEQLSLTRCVSALLRIAEDSYAEYFDIAQTALPNLVNVQFGHDCLKRFDALIKRPLPTAVRDAPRYSPFWAKQGLKEQLALLEVVFLLFYGQTSPDAAFVIALLKLIQETDMAQHQANEAFFDAESVQLLTSVKHLLALIAVESLDLERVMNGIELPTDAKDASSSLLASPDSIAQALDILESTKPDPARSPILLAWSLVLKQLEDVVTEAQESQRLPTHLEKLADVLTPRDGGQPIWSRLAGATFSPQLALLPTMRSMILSPFLSPDATSASFEVSVASSLAFRAVFKGLLLSVTEILRAEFVPDFNSLIALWESTFDASTTSDMSTSAVTGVAALSGQFWTADYTHETRRAVLETAARRWPVNFSPLLRLLKALTGTCSRSEAGSGGDDRATISVMQYFAKLTTLAQVLPTKAANTLRPPWEVIESPDHSTLEYRAKLPIHLFGARVLIPPGTCGRLVSELGKTPVVVVWDMPEEQAVSGWKIIRDVLANFVRLLPDSSTLSRRLASERSDEQNPFGDSSSNSPGADFNSFAPGSEEPAIVAAEILELFTAVLAGAPDQAGELLTHLDEVSQEDVVRSSSKMVQPSLVTITQRIIDQALGSSHDMPTRVISSAYKLLSLLLPHRPAEVWLALRSSNLVIASAGQASWTKQSAFNTSSSLLAFECARGSYQGTRALLDFHENLIREFQRSQLAISPDLLQIKVDVLLRALRWVCESIWPECQSWRFDKTLDKLSISVSCTSMLLAILTDQALNGSEAAREISRSVMDLLVSHASMLHLAPLVNTLATGHGMLSQYHRAGLHAEVEKMHELAHLSLRLACQMLNTRQRSLPQQFSLLERVLFDGSAVAVRSLPSGSRRSSRVGLISAIFTYLCEGLSLELAKDAASLITSICLSAHGSVAGQGRSLVGHLGTVDEVKSTVGSIMDLLSNTHQDIQLRSATWTMVAAMLQTQPTLAAMLLGGVDFGGMSSDAEFGSKPQPKTGATGSPSTALQVAVDAVLIWQAYWDGGEDVELLDALLHFLTSAWSQPENAAALNKARGDERFWKALTSIVTAEMESAPENAPSSFAEAVGALQTTENHEAVRVFAHRTTSKARALYILAQDVELSPASSNNKHLSIDFATRLVTEGAKFTFAVQDAVTFECDPALHADVEARMASTFPEMPLSLLRNPPKINDFDLSRSFGDDYVYSIATLRHKLEGFCEADTGEDEIQIDERAIQQAVLLVAGVNLDWSVIDSQATLLRSWTAFLEGFAKRVRLEHQSQQQRERQVSQACLEAWISAATITAREDREGSVMWGVHAARVKLLEVLLEGAWSAQMRPQASHTQATVTATDIGQLSRIVELAKDLLTHNVFSLESSLRGHERPPFHAELLPIALLCARRCRQALPLAEGRRGSRHSLDKSLSSSVSSAAISQEHRVIHLAIDVFTMQAIHALKILVDDILLLLGSPAKAETTALVQKEEELTVVGSLLELLIRSDVSLAPHFWLHQLQDGGALPACVTLLRRAPLRATPGDDGHINMPTQAPMFMPAILSLFLAMASQQQPAEQTVLAGLMTALSANTLSPALEAGQLVPGTQAHMLWITMLRLVVSVVENLDGDGGAGGAAHWAAASARFVELELVGFVRLYGAQMGRALHFSPLGSGSAPKSHHETSTTSVDAAQLHELHAVVRLFLVMASTESFAQTQNGQEILSTFGARVLGILQQLVHLLLRPHLLASLLSGNGDTSTAEDKTAEGTSSGTSSGRSSPVSRDQQALTTLMSTIASSAVSALWHSSRGLDMLGDDGALAALSWESTSSPLLRPSMRTNPQQPASIGTMLDLTSFFVDQLSGAGSEDGKKALVANIEQCLAFTIAQLKSSQSQSAASTRGGSTTSKAIESGISRDVSAAAQSALAAVKSSSPTEDSDFLEFLVAACAAV